MRTLILAAAILLLLAAPVAAEQVTWFPLIFNEGVHPPSQPDILGCYGYSQVPGYTGPPEYPLAVQPETAYITCYVNPGCRMGAVGQEGVLAYKCADGECTSRAVLAGDITIVLTNARLDNRHQDWWLVATREGCAHGVCYVNVVRWLYPWEQKLYAGGLHIAALPPDLGLYEANGVGLWREAVGLETWVTFRLPCQDAESHGVGQPEMWTTADLARFN